ncbi:MMPL family transporter [Corynebacterium sp. zg-331]|uniref:MMPL family transporter n=1 Tax=unclassified Corynebacterium TaxID=2624378 RepID=UPI00128B1BB8|nr:MULTISPECIES: MMPL family transporter [unclassified Corynebacterium]MBC3186860.1 MMPL family transporter [Corynebacterium sp. zg-331]MPV53340.1 MMPL family transporter [Corynebacterium sp. zg331]
MSRFLYRLGHLAYRRKCPFLAFWLVLLVTLGGLAGAFAKSPASSFSIPGLQAMETQERMQELFPESGDALSTPSGTVVLHTTNGAALNDPAIAAEIDALFTDLKDTGALTDTDSLVNPALAAQGLNAQMTPQLEAQGLPKEQIVENIAALSPLSEDATTGTANITFDAPTTQDIDSADLDAVTAALDNANSENLEVTYSGTAFTGAGEMDMTSELIGLAVAAVVLLITFGSVIAAGMPIFSAVIGVAIGIMGVQLATVISNDINDMTPTLASMIGLAVGIDYALFIASRFRNEMIALIRRKNDGNGDLGPAELARHIRDLSTAERAHAMGMATGTAGSSVVFAGLTVLIALAALSIINIPFLTWMALAAALTVAIAVMISLSFLPALLSLLGTRVFGGRIPGPSVPDPDNVKPTAGRRWAQRIGQRPWLSLISGVLLLGLLALPMLNMRLAMPTDGSTAPGTPQREAYETMSEAFGPGRNAPMIALVEAGDLPEQDRTPAFAQAVELFSATEGVVNAQIAGMSEEGTTAQILITPAGGTTDESTSETLAQLREAEPGFRADTGARYGLTGSTPIFDDMSDRLSDVLLPYIAIVLTLAFLVLMIVFRSVWVPLIAALGFGLSVAATFGVTVALFQEGWLGLVDDPQPLLSFLPIMLIGLVFGLAMDYQVFLVTRMREDYHHGMSAAEATESGFRHGARVVTAAALIMMSVFAAFILQDAAFIKTMGFALATAVFFDAFVVRMTIIPATMYLLGDRAWHIPGWLDRILPNVDVEGAALSTLREQSASSTTDE